jgi:hypothetical protein
MVAESLDVWENATPRGRCPQIHRPYYDYEILYIEMER